MFRYLVLIFILVFTQNTSFAGGSDGSEILGEKINSSDKISKQKLKKPFSAFNNNVEPQTKSVFSLCGETPQIEHKNQLKTTALPTNNLFRKTGMVETASGQLIVLTGNLYDIDCVPVSNATIKIWQTDSNGNYQSSYNLNPKWTNVSDEYDPNFGYSGATQTNNLGEYTFITIMPKAEKDDLAPHINIDVEHAFHGNINTKIYFDDIDNSNDKFFKKLNPELSDRLVAKSEYVQSNEYGNYKKYSLPLTFKSLDKYRKY